MSFWILEKNLSNKMLLRFAKILVFLLFYFVSLNASLASAKLDARDNKSDFNYSFSDKDSLVLGFAVESILVDDAVISYKDGDQVFIPLIAFSEILDFPIKLSEDGLVASGWFIDEGRSFELNLKNKNVISNQDKYGINSKDVKKFDDDIYVEVNFLKSIFAINIDLLELQQLLDISSDDHNFPLKKRIERRNRWEKKSKNDRIRRKNELEAASGVKQLKAPYKAISLPMSDFKYGFNRTSVKTNGKKNITDTSQFNGLLNGDLLYLNNRISFNITDSELMNAFVSSGRKDKDGGLLGPLKATEFSFGDVYFPDIPLVSRSIAGQGGMVTNYPSNYVRNVNTVPIRGFVQAGWDVEIYRNDFLIDTQTTSSDGQYNFPDFPLLSGNNVLKIVSYGPYGQIREETRIFNLNAEILEKGKFYYNVFSNKSNDNLFKGGSVQQKALEARKIFGKSRHFIETAYGMTVNSSILVNYAEIPLEEDVEHHRYGSLGLRVSLGRLYGKFSVVRDLDTGSKSFQSFLQTKISHYNLSATLDNFEKDFISDKRISSVGMSSKLITKLDGPIFLPFIKKSVRFSLTRTEEKYSSASSSGNSGSRIINSGNFSFAILSKLKFSQTFDSTKDKRNRGSNLDRGTSSLNFRLNSKFNLRSSLNFETKPKKKLTAHTVNANFAVGKDLIVGLTSNHQFATLNTKSSTEYGLNLSKNFKNFILSLGSRYSSRRKSINLDLSFSVGVDTTNHELEMSGKSMARSGSALVRVFLDENGNESYDEGEMPIEGVEINVSGTNRKFHTKDTGAVFIANLPVDSKATIKMLNNTDHFNWAPLHPVIKLQSHEGSFAEVDFPISIIGTIEGFVKINMNDKIKSLSDVALELVNLRGDLIQELKTSYDGYFYFDKVPIGHYKLRIQEKWSRDFGYGYGQLKKINLTQNADSLNLDDFILHKNKIQIGENDSDSEEIVKKDEEIGVEKSDLESDGVAEVEISLLN